MEEFYLKDIKGVRLPILEGFPENYLKEYGFPGSVKYHAYFGKLPLLFQTIKIGKYEIAISDYLTRNSTKLTCRGDTPTIEIYFVLTGKVLFNLKNLSWKTMRASSHNMIVLCDVKNETYFKISPVSTWDIHFTEADFILLCKKYPRLLPLLDAWKQNKNNCLYAIPERTNPLMLHLIVQIIIAIKAGLEDHPSTIDMVERLIIMVLEAKPVITRYRYDYNDIEKLHRASRLIEQYLDEKDILDKKMKETGLKPDKFREGFLILFGVLPGDYLSQKRREKAHKLVTEGRATSAEDVAQLCGYESTNHLGRVYFEHYGIKLSDILRENRKRSK